MPLVRSDPKALGCLGQCSKPKGCCCVVHSTGLKANGGSMMPWWRCGGGAAQCPTQKIVDFFSTWLGFKQTLELLLIYLYALTHKFHIAI